MSNISSGSSRAETESFLKKRGCQLLGRDQREVVVVRVDGKDHLGELVADYTVMKNGKRYVVWGVRGEGASDPTDPTLRRRLIELDRVFGLDGILIVDPAEGAINEVHFKYPRERGLDFYFQFLGALFVIALVLGIIWLMVAVRLF
jgi:hypothetical protein